MIYKDKIFTLFPQRDKLNDINLDNEGKGTLERYNETVGLYIDEDLSPLVDNLVDNLLDVEICLDKFLNYLESDKGVSLVYTGAPELYRRAVLKHVMAWYQIKGTEKLLRVLLAMIGLEHTLIEIYPTTGFDSEITFDDPQRRFDGKCNTCVGYSLDLTGEDESLSPEKFKALISILDFNMPFDIEIKECFYNGDIAVDYTVNIATSRSSGVSYNNPYDNSLKISYDEDGQPIIETKLPYYEIISPTQLKFVFLGELLIS